MLKKFHLQLTIVCTVITGIIMIAMSLFCLYIAESGLTQNDYGNFLTSVNGIYSHLKSQTDLTTEWFAQTENNGQFTLYIEDNGIPVKYGSQTTDQNRAQLINQALTAAARDYNVNIKDFKSAKVVPKQTDFIFYDKTKVKYYVSAAFIPKAEGSLGVLAIYSLKQHSSEIIKQRLLFGGIDVAAILLLCIFSYFFTKRVLIPIERNQKQQVEFIAAASHELRSPLAVITSCMSAIKKSDSVQARRFEEIVNSEINRMSRLVNDMLSLANADSNNWSLQLEENEMDLLLLNVYEAFSPIASKKNVQLGIDLPEELLPVCTCDRQRIEQVLTILVDNALTYTQAGGKVTLSVSQKAHNVEISVADTGIGISDKDKNHIFQRFYRADPAHKSKEHFGLGLCIAYEIVKLHKGSLSVTDTPGGGTTFVLSLNV